MFELHCSKFELGCSDVDMFQTAQAAAKLAKLTLFALSGLMPSKSPIMSTTTTTTTTIEAQ